MKTKILIAIVAIALNITSHAQNTHKEMPEMASGSSIHFIEGQWDVANKEAVKSKKYIFVDAYATWCGPCKQLKATTFKDKEIAAFFNEHFINVSLDVEKGQGPKLAAKWKVQGLPTLIIFDSKGKKVAQLVGYVGTKDLMDFGKEALAKK